MKDSYTREEVHKIMNRVVRRLRSKSVNILQHIRKTNAKKSSSLEKNRHPTSVPGLYQRSLAYEEACNIILEEMEAYK